MKNLNFNPFNEYNLNIPQGGSVDVNVSVSDDIVSFIKNLESLVGDDNQNEKVCPNCGTKWHEVAVKMETGCEVCYQTFKNELNDILKTRNLYPNLSNTNEIDRLKEELEVAIRLEKYERAEEIKHEIMEALDDSTRL